MAFCMNNFLFSSPISTNRARATSSYSGQRNSIMIEYFASPHRFSILIHSHWNIYIEWAERMFCPLAIASALTNKIGLYLTAARPIVHSFRYARYAVGSLHLMQHPHTHIATSLPMKNCLQSYIFFLSRCSRLQPQKCTKRKNLFAWPN